MADALPVCILCGQELGDRAIVARYERNLKLHEHQWLKQAEADVRAALEKEYTDRDKKRITTVIAEADERAQRKYGTENRALRRALGQANERANELTRRYEKLSSAYRGAFNEEDLLATLRQEFADDRIDRIKGGHVGRSDILHDVRYRAGQRLASAGVIIYECKDTLHWNNSFVAQALGSKALHRANHAILVSRVLPRNEKGFAMVDTVAVVSPSCMTAIAQVFRQGLVEVARAGLTSEGQRAKTEELYGYLSSEDFKQVFRSAAEATSKLHDSLLKEQTAHNRTWAQRRMWYEKLSGTMVAIQETISDILARPAKLPAPAEAELVVVVDLSSGPAFH